MPYYTRNGQLVFDEVRAFSTPATEPVEVQIDRSTLGGGMFASPVATPIPNFGGTPGGIVPGVGSFIGNLLGLVPIGGSAAAPEPPQLPAVITRTAQVVGPGLARWVSLAWRLLVQGTAVTAVVEFLQSTMPASQETAVAVVEKAVRTRGGRRRMNPCNPKALKRAITRINRFDKFADATEKIMKKYARRR